MTDMRQAGIYIVFFFLLGGILASVGSYSILKLREEHQRTTHMHHTRLLAEQIDNMVTDYFKIVMSLSRNPAVLAFLRNDPDAPDPKIPLILETAARISRANRVYIINRAGIILAGARTMEKSAADTDSAFRPYVIDAWKGRTTVFPAVEGGIDAVKLHFSTPIYGPSKESVDGILVLELEIPVIEDLLYQRMERVAIVSASGVIFAANTPEWLYRSPGQLTPDTLQHLEETKQFSGRPITPLGTNLDFDKGLAETSGRHWYKARVALPISGWEIISLQEQDKGFRLPRLYQYLVGIGLLVTGGLAVLAFFLTMTIRSQKKTQQELSRTKEIYSSIFKNAVMGIYQSTLEGYFIDVNPSMAQILGYETPSLLMSEVNRIDRQIYLNPDDRQTFVSRVTSQGQVRGFETRFIRRDGQVIWVQLSGRLAKDPGREETFLEGFCIDITEKVAAQEKAAERQQQLVAADRMISMGVLASGVAHEINNPNTFIHSNAQFLSDAWKEADIILNEYFLENGDFIISGLPYARFREKLPKTSIRILEGTRRIARIIKELRNYSRNDPTPVRSSVDVNQVIQSALILLGNMIKKSTRNFTLELSGDIPRVPGSFQRLEQVIVNIVQNACQAMNDETGAIYVSSAWDSDLEKVKIVCKDEGCGIPQKDLKRVCDPFFTTKRDSGGTGLGLSISSTIIQELGGCLDIMSEQGKGTTMTLYLPSFVGPFQRPTQQKAEPPKRGEYAG